MSVKELNSENFKETIAEGITFVDFWADWCTPCKMIAPAVARLSEEMKGKLNFGKLDTDANVEIAQQFEIFSIPTMIIFKDGEVAGRITGAYPEENIKEFIEETIK